jgi:hypothetical protein
MIARNKTSKSGKVIPQDWSEGVARLLNETYKSHCESNGRYFDVFGQVYPEELLMVVSYLSEKDPHESPITLFLSCAPKHIADEAMVKETQKNYIDVAGLFFDEIFSNEDWNGFEPAWQEVTHHTETYFFKISRENLNATIEANKLLGPEFETFEEEEFDE